MFLWCPESHTRSPTGCPSSSARPPPTCCGNLSDSGWQQATFFLRAAFLARWPLPAGSLEPSVQSAPRKHQPGPPHPPPVSMLARPQAARGTRVGEGHQKGRSHPRLPVSPKGVAVRTAARTGVPAVAGQQEVLVSVLVGAPGWWESHMIRKGLVNLLGNGLW